VFCVCSDLFHSRVVLGLFHSRTGSRILPAMQVEPFLIAIPQADLDDLQRRLAHARWSPELDNDDWRHGTSGRYLRELVEYWRTGFDWRVHERAMNQLPQFRVQIDGTPIHFVHRRGRGPAPMPLLLGHGWPWTFWDFQKVIEPLADPVRFGGDAGDAFDVVVPSLPGYAFSTPLATPGINFWRTADLWVTLMDGLGYARFAAQGGDWGALVAAQLGHKYADRLYGVHLHFLTPLGQFGGRSVDAGDYADDERHLLEANRHFVHDGTATRASSPRGRRRWPTRSTTRRSACARGSSRSAAPGATAAATSSACSPRTIC
jgi:pimeloyl-ACP methyl ester carboxylesterase